MGLRSYRVQASVRSFVHVSRRLFSIFTYLCKALRSAAPGSLTATSPSSINCFTLPRSPLCAALCRSVSVGMVAFHGEWPRCGPTHLLWVDGGTRTQTGKAPRREPTRNPGSCAACDARRAACRRVKCHCEVKVHEARRKQPTKKAFPFSIYFKGNRSLCCVPAVFSNPADTPASSAQCPQMSQGDAESGRTKQSWRGPVPKTIRCNMSDLSYAPARPTQDFFVGDDTIQTENGEPAERGRAEGGTTVT